MSKEQPRIIRNSAKCLVCNTEIESKFCHDWVSCKCGDIFVDGGRAYIRHGYKDLSTILDTSIYDESQEPKEEDYN